MKGHKLLFLNAEILHEICFVCSFVQKMFQINSFIVKKTKEGKKGKKE